MGWTAGLHDDRGHLEGDWQYTYNTSRMVYLALDRNEYTFDERNWIMHLNEMTGAEGAEFLGLVIKEMEGDPEAFRALDPPNGWGDYDGMLRVLKEMHQACLVEWPTIWSASG
jgi:hypothetical protein